MKLVLQRKDQLSQWILGIGWVVRLACLECLGHIIDDQGIHPNIAKLNRIQEWHIPRTYKNIQWFVGLVNYISNFLPDISAYMGLLMAIMQNGSPFQWQPLHQRCFEMIKHICSETPVIKLIDPSKEDCIWLIFNASKTGIRAMYGQGPTWQACRPARFMSKKFTNAQHNYAVHELEMLVILEALLKWEDKLLEIWMKSLKWQWREPNIPCIITA